MKSKHRTTILTTINVLNRVISTRSTLILFVLFASGAMSVVYADPEADYQTYCSICHDNPDIQTPDRANLESMGRTRLAFSLTDGKMAPYVTALTTQQINDLVILLAKNDDQDVDESGFCSNRDVSTEVALSHWGFDNHNTRHQRLSSITSQNVSQLELKWVFGVPNTGEMRSLPALSTDTIFLPTRNGKLYALSRDNGCLKWVWDAGTPLRSSANLFNFEDRGLIAVTNDATTLFLVDAKTGELVWSANKALFPMSSGTGSPVVNAGALYLPISSFEIAVAMRPTYECCRSHGGVRRIELSQRRDLWIARTTQTAQKTKKNKVGTQMWGPSGAPVWTTPALDLKRNQLYIGTGENTSSPATHTSDAIIAIDLDTGERNWVYQGVADDAFNMACGLPGNRNANCPDEEGPDFDFGASPILVEVNDGRELVVAGQKSGDVWAIDPDNGELVWHRKLSNGSVLGGVHWGLAIVDQTVYVPIADPEHVTRRPRPGLYAIDLKDGEVKWRYRAERGCELSPSDFQQRQGGEYTYPSCSYFYGFSAAASATNDVVFAGALDGKAFAFHADTGEVLWQYDTKRPFESINNQDAHGGAIDNPGIAIAGNQVMVSSGYSLFGQMPGNVLLVFEAPN